MEKIATLAPIPRANVSTAIAVKPGFFASVRAAMRKSLISFIVFSPIPGPRRAPLVGCRWPGPAPLGPVGRASIPGPCPAPRVS